MTESPGTSGMLKRVTSWPRRHPRLIDALLAGLLWVLLVMTQSGVSPDMRRLDYPWAVTLIIGSLQTLPLALRRVRPVTTFTVVSLACFASAVSHVTLRPGDFGFLFALYALAAFARNEGARRSGLLVVVAAAVTATLAWDQNAAVSSAWSSIAEAVSLFAVGTAVWLWGNATRNRRLMLESLESRNAALVRERDQRALLAAQGERTRIAREMHDIVAHSLAVIVVQADGAAFAARHAATWSRGDASNALDTIGVTAREALAGTRSLVNVLRADGPGGGASGEPPVDYRPAETLADVPPLVQRVRESGLDVRLETPDPLPRPDSDVGLVVYRIVQECLTNVIKHAGPDARSLVRISQDGSDLEVTVADDGHGAAATDFGSGHGLVGMRERVTAVGGTLRTGPRVGGGYAVTARIPGRREDT